MLYHQDQEHVSVILLRSTAFLATVCRVVRCALLFVVINPEAISSKIVGVSFFFTSKFSPSVIAVGAAFD